MKRLLIQLKASLDRIEIEGVNTVDIYAESEFNKYYYIVNFKVNG